MGSKKELMMQDFELIDSCMKKVINGNSISFEEAEKLISTNNLTKLAHCANIITKKFNQEKVDVESLINAKSGNCPEDCSFCAQSTFYETGITKYPLLSDEVILEKAREAQKSGSASFCLVCAYREPSQNDFEKICKIIENLKNEVNLDINVSLGFMTPERAKRLKLLGVKRYNHNLEASESFFSKICNTHDYSDRVKTARIVKEAGLELCCGGIIGMGESKKQRIELAYSLSALDPDEVPINILIPREGTPKELDKYSIDPMDIIRTIAVWRFIMPKTILKIAGGREVHFNDGGKLALQAGANGIITGGYLTTNGNEPNKDIQMIHEIGLDTRIR
ncbi:MAG: biotin synthase BioB [Nitrososphaeraceae archaeon]|nr:biotin synthase BioB [Nitrososphaeraceae archaeon]MDW0154860.1 biotin synthase BioB [Nitrososphaeraceae archaeon]